MRQFARCAALFAAITITAPAFAGAPSKVRKSTNVESYEYRFDDDLVQTMGNASGSLVITGHGKGARAGLVRPRVQFVPELLKSVETL